MMERDEALPFLRSLLYSYLFRRHVVASAEYIAELRRSFVPEEFGKLEASLAWAASNTEFSFSSLPEVRDATEADIREHFGCLLALIRSLSPAEQSVAR